MPIGTPDTSIRHGAGQFLIKDYGGVGDPVAVSVDQSEGGMEFAYNGETKDVPAANHLGAVERLLTGENAKLTIGILDHELDKLVLSFGHDDGDIVDDAVAVPNTRTLEFGGPRNLPKFTVQMKCPQPTLATLFDILNLWRVTAKPEYTAAYEVGKERFIPVEFNALVDVAGTEGTAGTLGSLVQEITPLPV